MRTLSIPILLLAIPCFAYAQFGFRGDEHILEFGLGGSIGPPQGETLAFPVISSSYDRMVNTEISLGAIATFYVDYNERALFALAASSAYHPYGDEHFDTFLRIEVGVAGSPRAGISTFFFVSPSIGARWYFADKHGLVFSAGYTSGRNQDALVGRLGYSVYFW